VTKIELERALEDRCAAKIEARGGLCLKLAIPGVRGFFDRTVLMPGAKAWFFETKRMRTGRVSSQQHRWQVVLFQLGFGAYLIDSDEQFDAALEREMAK